MAKIVVVDDDPAMDLLVDGLRYRGHEAKRIASVSDALKDLESVLSAEIVILDILMPWPDGVEGKSSPETRQAGMELLREIRKSRNDLPVIALSATQDTNIIEALKDDPATTFISKWESHPIRELISLVHTRLGIRQETIALHPFIVHGHADKLKFELKNYLQNTLHLREPTILHEQPGLGRTVIEKFENYAGTSALVFVLLTPDDEGAPVTAPDDVKRRARQNVIFEMGYFLGLLGRESGRVVLLYSGALELPSDLAGVVYVDISNGIVAAGEAIRREITGVL